MRLRPVLVILAAAALACGGPAPREAAVAEAPAGPARVVLEAPWTDLGWPPGPPWDVGAEVSPGMPTKDPTRDLSVHYRKPPGTPEEALVAWRDAAVAKGWEVDEKYKADPLYVYLRRTGARVRVEADEHYGLVMRLDYDPKEVVLDSWPSDPSCPEGTRRHPKAKKENGCYELGTEMVEHGPWERLEDGKVVERGQFEHGVRVGVWTLDEADPVEEDRYTVTREYAADGAYAETWVRQRDGARICSMARDARNRDTGEWTWWNEDGSVAAVYPHRDGVLDPSIATAPDGGLQIGFSDDLQILDVAPVAGLVAWKRIVHDDSEREVVDCKYAGMQADPLAGVTLGVSYVDSGLVETFDVYAVAATEEACLSEAASKEALAAAKARWAELGLDPDRKPAPLVPSVSGKVATLRLAGADVTLESDRITGDVPMTDHEAYVLGSSSASGYAIARWGGALSGPRLWVPYDKSNAGSAEIELVGGWEADGKAVLAWRVVHQPWRVDWHFERVPTP